MRLEPVEFDQRSRRRVGSGAMPTLLEREGRCPDGGPAAEKSGGEAIADGNAGGSAVEDEGAIVVGALSGLLVAVEGFAVAARLLLLIGTVLAVTRAGGRSEDVRGREAAEKGVARWRKERGCASEPAKASTGEADEAGSADEAKAEMMWAGSLLVALPRFLETAVACDVSGGTLYE